MRSFARGVFALLVAAAAGCSGDESTPDAGVGPAPTDAGGRDALPTIDAGPAADAGFRADAGPRDAGFADPAILLEGREELSNGLPTWIRMSGTLTSTMPPLIVLSDGPALSHEYLPPHTRFVEPGRLMVYYDKRASGRTSYGTLTGSSTITVAAHVEDLGFVVEWLGGYVDVTRVDLLGHGYGATVAALWAADNPSRVDRLILVTPYPTRIEHFSTMNQEYQRRLTGPDRERFAMVMNRPECIRDVSQCFLTLFGISGPKSMCEQHRDRWNELDFVYGEFRSQYFVETDLRNRAFDFRDELTRVRAATTIVGGACDTVPIESTREYATAITGATLVELSDSGHWPMVETSTTYRALVGRALVR